MMAIRASIFKKKEEIKMSLKVLTKLKREFNMHVRSPDLIF